MEMICLYVLYVPPLCICVFVFMFSVVYCAQINLQRNVAAACLMFNK